jgi:hypothetical protein
MRFMVPATAAGLCLMALGMMVPTPPAVAQPAAPQLAASQPTAPLPAAYNTVPANTVPTSAAMITDGPGAGSDAAARHAKRTACLKEAKAKKLVGADKNSFIKDCVAAR